MTDRNSTSASVGRIKNQTDAIEEMLKHSTIYIEHPNGGCVKIESPKAFQDADDMVNVMTRDGAIYTAHKSRVLIYIEPKEEGGDE